MNADSLQVSAPGRICLFGEHQDYFGLSIIAAAINLRITASGRERKDRLIKISLPDIREEEEFSLEKELAYEKERDYLRSAINILQRQGIHLDSGWDCLIQGTIPINAGSASSSALVVAWVKFLLESVKDERAASPETIAELGFLSEVAEFKEPGGKMDHFSSALGGVISIDFSENMRVKTLKNPLKEFVLADSLQKKDTTGMLGTIKNHVLQGVDILGQKIEGYSLKSPLSQEVQDEIGNLPPEPKRLLKGTLLTRDLTIQGNRLFESDVFDHVQFGELLTRQFEILRNYLHISTPKIEQMIEESLKAGAMGAKINGSGGGGCIFAYAPDRAENVAEALERLGAKVYIIRVDEGVKREK